MPRGMPSVLRGGGTTDAAEEELAGEQSGSQSIAERSTCASNLRPCSPSAAAGTTRTTQPYPYHDHYLQQQTQAPFQQQHHQYPYQYQHQHQQGTHSPTAVMAPSNPPNSTEALRRANAYVESRVQMQELELEQDYRC